MSEFMSKAVLLICILINVEVVLGVCNTKLSMKAEGKQDSNVFDSIDINCYYQKWQATKYMYEGLAGYNNVTRMMLGQKVNSKKDLGAGRWFYLGYIGFIWWSIHSS